MEKNAVKLNEEDYEAIKSIKENKTLSEGLKNKCISDIINHRCPECNTALEEVQLIEEDFEGMTEGQMADYETGFNRTFYCPKCKINSLRDIEVYDIDDDENMPTPQQLESLEKGRRTSWNNRRIRGFIAEMWFANKLRNYGYKVRKTMYYDYETGVSIFNEKGVENLLQKHPKKDEIMKLLNSFEKGYPDLICLKDKIISFYEVKSNDSEVKEHQKQVMKTLKSEDYEVKTVRLNVEYKVEETN